MKEYRVDGRTASLYCQERERHKHEEREEGSKAFNPGRVKQNAEIESKGCRGEGEERNESARCRRPDADVAGDRRESAVPSDSNPRSNSVLRGPARSLCYLPSPFFPLPPPRYSSPVRGPTAASEWCGSASSNPEPNSPTIRRKFHRNDSLARPRVPGADIGAPLISAGSTTRSDRVCSG